MERYDYFAAVKEDNENVIVVTSENRDESVTGNDFNKFVSSVNRSLLPAGITFKMK